ncbi:MAG: hypothetical protein WAM72_20705, partial [Xanthobacteraceae bacterium]
MIHARFAVAAIVASVTIAVGLPELIKRWCTSAHAQTQTAPPESTIWDHNGSVMYLVVNGSSREFYYQKPRPGMLDAGARPGSVLFRGEVNNGQYLGTAYIFNPHCAPIPFEVKGPILDDQRIMLTGRAPRVGRNCQTYGAYTSNLEFRLSKPNEVAQSEVPLAAAQSPPVGVAKPEVPSRTGDERPRAAAAQPSVKNETPVEGKDSSARVTDPEATSMPQPSITSETTGGRGLRDYLWGAAFIVMIVWLLIVIFGKTLIR